MINPVKPMRPRICGKHADGEKVSKTVALGKRRRTTVNLDIRSSDAEQRAGCSGLGSLIVCEKRHGGDDGTVSRNGGVGWGSAVGIVLHMDDAGAMGCGDGTSAKGTRP
eukprot:5526647-Prymnesium_polylepis.1